MSVKKNGSGMRETKKLTVSALMCALTVVLLLIASFLGDIDLTILMLSSFCMVFVYLEIGAPYTYLTWVVSTLLTLLIFPARYFWILYFLLFGIYPILKGYFERLARPLWLITKLAYFNAVLWLAIFLLRLVLGVDLLDGDMVWWRVLLCVLANVSFVAYDFFMTLVVRIYVSKYRERIKHLLR